jgi:hypothetical protein
MPRENFTNTRAVEAHRGCVVIKSDKGDRLISHRDARERAASLTRMADSGKMDGHSAKEVREACRELAAKASEAYGMTKR